MTKPVRALMLLALGVLGATTAWLVRPVRGRGFEVKARYLHGRLRGMWHGLFGPPQEDVSDKVLADRVRSALGPVEKVLDVPRPNVAAVGHRVTLHGVVGTEAEAERLIAAVKHVPSVEAVESHLVVGITGADSRPSTGHATRPPSPMLQQLLEAVHHASGDGAASARPTLRAVLLTLLECLPEGERAHLTEHLAADVRDLAAGAGPHHRVEHVGEFADVVTRRGAVQRDKAERVVEAVFAELRRLVPEEVLDVAAVLPIDLKRTWQHSLPA